VILLRFGDGTGWQAGLVRWGTWSPFSHVSFRLDDGRLLDATPNCGVSIRRVSDDEKTEYWRPTVPLGASEAAVAWAKTQIGKPYDWSGITGFTLRRGVPTKRDWHDQKAWFCSEIVCCAYDVVGAPLLQDSGAFNRITPRDLLLSTQLERYFPSENALIE
jgi:uncharacterized protein YycO